MSAAEMVVLLRLADRARDDTWDAWPAVPTIAKETGLSSSTVRESLRKLKTRELVMFEASRGGDPRTTTNRFTLNVTKETPPEIGGVADGDPTENRRDPTENRRAPHRGSVPILKAISNEPAAAAEGVAHALETIADRRMAAKAAKGEPITNPAGYRRQVIQGLRRDHADKLASLNPTMTPAAIIEFLEPAPLQTIPGTKTSRCHTCDGKHHLNDVDGNNVVIPCPDCVVPDREEQAS